jgi:hypothetical protein
MKIYVIIRTYIGADTTDDYRNVSGDAFFNENDAKAYVEEMNAKRTSSYSCEYEYEEVEVK